MSVRHTAVALLLLPFVSGTTHAQTTIPAWTYAMNITYDSGTGVAKRGSIAMRYRSSAAGLRMEFMQVGGTANPAGGISIEGMYTLMNDSTFTTVMPSEHMATVMDNPMKRFAGNNAPSIDAHGTSTKTEDLGPGEKLLGHATHRYRYTTTGTMTTTIGGQACTRSMDGETEVWIAPDVDMGPAMRSVVAQYGMSIPDSALAQRDPSTPKGTPLRSRMRQSVTLPSGESRVITTTMEYVELSNAPLDVSMFAVPSDVKVMDMRKMMAKMPAGLMDSVIAAQKERHPAGCR